MSADNAPSILKSALKFLLLAFPIVAQAAGPVTPNAGSILQQVQPLMPQVPSSTGTGLTIEQQGSGNLPPSSPFEVKRIQLSGNTLFDIPTLHALVENSEGKTITLSDLGELAARITDYYHTHGYPLARAYIPAQTIEAGLVRIEIIEARYGKVKLDNHSRVVEPLLDATLSVLQSGQFIGQAGMDRILLLLSDVPGVEISATLKPGETVGTSDLLVEAIPGPLVSGNLALDNYGNQYTGRKRAGATVNFINPFRHGDYISLGGLTSGDGMNYARASYDVLLNGRGSHIGGSYSSMYYILGDTLASLNGHGTARVGSLWVRHPFMRSRDVNLYGQVQYDRMMLRDHIDASGIQTDRHLDIWTANLSGDDRDTFLPGEAINTWSVVWASGRVIFDNAGAQSTDAQTGNTQAGFSKWNVSFSRLQSVGQKNALFISFAGQLANGNLDSSQKLAVGGANSVRAYDMGAVSGDTGLLLTTEFRRDLGQLWQGSFQSVGFVDTAHMTINKNVWGGGANSAILTGVGVGLSWMGPNRWSARTYIAKPVGSTPELTGIGASTRVWLDMGRSF